MNDIYEPGEDSLLLKKYVKEYAFGKILDMGTGSGILGLTAQNNPKAKEVAFADINPLAIKKLKSVAEERNSKFIITDLFQNMRKKEGYDTIIFNPPYLPEDPYDKAKEITTGGKKGHEILEKFLAQAKEHLNDGGIILITFSSLTNRRKIDKIIRGLGYDKELLGKERMFMEELYAYILTPIIYYKGHRGNVRTRLYKYKDRFFVAAEKSPLKNYNSSKEAKFLKILNKKGIGPKLFKHNKKNDSITIEFIYGQRIMEYFRENSKKEILKQIKLISLQLLLMDKSGINKSELTNPYKHIILSEYTIPVMIDFERAYYGKPKNITQFIQFLTSGKMQYLYKDKRMKVDVERMRDIAGKYKRRVYYGIIDDIISCLS